MCLPTFLISKKKLNKLYLINQVKLKESFYLTNNKQVKNFRVHKI